MTEFTDFNLLRFDSIPSTQDMAHEIIAAGRATNNTIIIAREQTKGRGRNTGHAWISPDGNMYATFIFDSYVNNPANTYLFAIAACETIIINGAPGEIKWPNDILINGAKTVGILIEYVDGWTCVGIGINIMNCPNDVRYRWQALDQDILTPKIDKTYCDIATDKVQNWNKDATIDSVLATLANKIPYWQHQDFDTIKQRWIELALKDRGYVTIKDDGALVIKDGDSYKLVYSVMNDLPSLTTLPT